MCSYDYHETLANCHDFAVLQEENMTMKLLNLMILLLLCIQVGQLAIQRVLC